MYSVILLVTGTDGSGFVVLCIELWQMMHGTLELTSWYFNGEPVAFGTVSEYIVLGFPLESNEE